MSIYELVAEKFPDKFEYVDEGEGVHFFMIKNQNPSHYWYVKNLESYKRIGIYLLIAEQIGVKVWATWNSLSDCWHGWNSLTDVLSSQIGYMKFITQEQAILAALTQAAKEMK
jgi:hypothetical protein